MITDHKNDVTAYPNDIYREPEFKINPLKIKSVKITPDQLEELTRHLEIAGDVLNSEFRLDWEDQETACRNIHDALQELKIIRESATAAIGF